MVDVNETLYNIRHTYINVNYDIDDGIKWFFSLHSKYCI